MIQSEKVGRSNVTRDERDVLKQLTTYADRIAAFSLVQALSFVLGVGGSDRLGGNVQNHPYITAGAILVSLPVYCYLLVRCHRNEDRLVGAPEKEKNHAVGKAVREMRRLRFVVVIIATLMCLGITASAVFLPVSHQQHTQV